MEPAIMRPFAPKDIDAAINIMRSSFPAEMEAMGITVDDTERQYRSALRLRMVPFRLLTALSRITWEFWVAELGGEVVGVGMFVGRKHIHLAGLMVAPEYRRRGIGQALLVKRLERIRHLGFPLATVSVLTTNEASLGNLRKQHFCELERYSLYEHSLPLPQTHPSAGGNVIVRPLRRSDRAAFCRLEQEMVAPDLRNVRDSLATRYFRSPADQLLDRLGRLRNNNLGLELDGTLIGCIAVRCEADERIGSIERPLIAVQNATQLDLLLNPASAWLTAQGKTAMQITVPDDRTDLIDRLLTQGWHKRLTWVDLIKKLDNS